MRRRDSRRCSLPCRFTPPHKRLRAAQTDSKYPASPANFNYHTRAIQQKSCIKSEFWNDLIFSQRFEATTLSNHLSAEPRIYTEVILQDQLLHPTIPDWRPALRLPALRGNFFWSANPYHRLEATLFTSIWKAAGETITPPQHQGFQPGNYFNCKNASKHASETSWRLWAVGTLRAFLSWLGIYNLGFEKALQARFTDSRLKRNDNVHQGKVVFVDYLCGEELCRA